MKLKKKVTKVKGKKKTADGLTVASHFEDREPVVREIYERLVAALRENGPVEEDPKKTSIHLNRRTAVAGVATRKSYLVLTIKADRALDSARVHRSEKVSASRFHHQVKLTSPSEVDSELKRWLEAAYALGA